jgi:hypothetical protein
MTGKNPRLNAILAAAALTLATARGAAAQWSAGTYGVAELDTKQTFYALAGVSASPKGLGFKPLLTLQTSYLTFDAGRDRHRNVFIVKPAVGLINNYGEGDVYADIGYAFATDNNSAPVAANPGRGTVVSAGWDHWGAGTSAPLAYQALGSWNFETESFWGRARATGRLSQNGARSVRIGPEVAYYSGKGYHGWQPGGILEFHMPNGSIVGLGAGAKIQDPSANAAYFRLEGYLPLRR